MTAKKKRDPAAPPQGDQAERKTSQSNYSTTASDNAKGRRAKSHYLRGSAYMPDDEKLSRCKRAVLRLLRKHGRDGITRIEAPFHLILSWPARICELRAMGYPIDSKRERFHSSWVARYFLVPADDAPDGHE